MKAMSRSTKAESRTQILTSAVEAHRGRLFPLIYKKVRDREEAHDVFQDVVAEFVEAYDLGQAIENLGAWLVTVAQNKILDRFRKKKSQEAHQNSARLMAPSERESHERLPERPDEEWVRTWMRSAIIQAIERLPRAQREVFIQHELEGKSFEEIAAETKISVNTLLSRKRYAVIQLREHLKEIYDELE